MSLLLHHNNTIQSASKWMDHKEELHTIQEMHPLHAANAARLIESNSQRLGDLLLLASANARAHRRTRGNSTQWAVADRVVISWMPRVARFLSTPLGRVTLYPSYLALVERGQTVVTPRTGRPQQELFAERERYGWR